MLHKEKQLTIEHCHPQGQRQQGLPLDERPGQTLQRESWSCLFDKHEASTQVENRLAFSSSSSRGLHTRCWGFPGLVIFEPCSLQIQKKKKDRCDNAIWVFLFAAFWAREREHKPKWRQNCQRGLSKGTDWGWEEEHVRSRLYSDSFRSDIYMWPVSAAGSPTGPKAQGRLHVTRARDSPIFFQYGELDRDLDVKHWLDKFGVQVIHSIEVVLPPPIFLFSYLGAPEQLPSAMEGNVVVPFRYFPMLCAGLMVFAMVFCVSTAMYFDLPGATDTHCKVAFSLCLSSAMDAVHVKRGLFTKIEKKLNFPYLWIGKKCLGKIKIHLKIEIEIILKTFTCRWYSGKKMYVCNTMQMDCVSLKNWTEFLSCFRDQLFKHFL